MWENPTRVYCPRARIALFFSRRTSGVILNGAERSEESLCLGGAGERFFAALRMTGKPQFLAAQSIVHRDDMEKLHFKKSERSVSSPTNA
jgi:hypothetical protein